MSLIVNIRCVLLSSPYADADDPEIKECFPNGPKRTIGMVEVTLEDGRQTRLRADIEIMSVDSGMADAGLKQAG